MDALASTGDRPAAGELADPADRRRRAGALDRSELKALFETEKDSLHRFLQRLTRNASDADDLVQETFMAIWRKRDQFQGGNAAAYLRSTAYRLFLNSRERSRRRAHLAPTVSTANGFEIPEERPAEGEQRELIGFLVGKVHEALETLPEAAREAFVLFRYEGLTCAQIAELVGAPAKTVETRLGRATQLLGARLRPYRHHMTGLGQP